MGTWCLHHVRTEHTPAVLAGVICSVTSACLDVLRGCAGAYLLACLCNLLYKHNRQCVSMQILTKDEEINMGCMERRWRVVTNMVKNRMLYRLW